MQLKYRHDQQRLNWATRVGNVSSKIPSVSLRVLKETGCLKENLFETAAALEFSLVRNPHHVRFSENVFGN